MGCPNCLVIQRCLMLFSFFAVHSSDVLELLVTPLAVTGEVSSPLPSQFVVGVSVGFDSSYMIRK